MATQIKNVFVNMCVKDLDKSIKFFKELGFTFNPQFTDQNAACLVINETTYSMLITEKFFGTFIEKMKKSKADTVKNVEVLIAMQVESRKKADELADKALKMGGKVANPPTDYGWMYGRSFQDLDSHIWEVFFMDAKKKPK